MMMFLDEISHWLQSQGVHPVLGGIIIGFIVAKVFTSRRPAAAAVISGMPGSPVPTPHSRSTISSGNITISQAAVGLDPATTKEVTDLLAKDNKIQAIKVLRQATGLGLAEAKSAVEGIEVATKLRSGS